MEVSNEIKEDIRKTQTELKNAIRVHQVWVTRLQEDENNIHLKAKVKEAEGSIIAIGQTQKRVVDRLRRELELYQQRLKARDKQVNIENDNRYVAQQLRDHQIQYRHKSRTISLLKPSVLNEIHVKSENSNGNNINDLSDSESDIKSSYEKENSNHSDIDDKDRYQRSFQPITNTVQDSRSNLVNALNKVKESFITAKLQRTSEWQERQQRSDCDSLPPSDHNELSPSPSPPPLPRHGEKVTQETFLRLIGLVTPQQKEILISKRNERRKRSTTSTNRTDFLYENFDGPKRKRYNNFPYLQTHSDPPQTRSAKLRKQQKESEKSEKSSREGSPSRSSSENKDYASKDAWPSVPTELREPYAAQKVCHTCGRSDAPSLLVWCSACSVFLHTGCSEDGLCGTCGEALPEPERCAAPSDSHARLYRDKLIERKRLQEKNIQLCIELRKLEARAASLKENLDDHQAEKRQLLANQIRTQRDLHKLLDFISQFKETSVSLHSTSISETSSERSKSNDE